MPLYCFAANFGPVASDAFVFSRRVRTARCHSIAIDEGKDVRGLFSDNRFWLTTVADYLEINQYFLENGEEGLQKAPAIVGPHTQLLNPLYIDEGSVIGSGCGIGHNVYIGINAWIGNRVRLENVVF
jgi:NDP-sugar pyrophosphorylase family protein